MNPLIVLAVLDTLTFATPRWMPYEGTCDSLSPAPEDSVMVLLERLRYPETAWRMVDSMLVAAGDSTRFFVVDLGGCSPCAFRKWARDQAGNVSCNPSKPINLPRPVNPVGVGERWSFRVDRVIPSPVRERAAVPFSLDRAGNARLELFDLTGRMVRVLAQGRMDAGPHLALFDAHDLRPGVYFVRLRQGARQTHARIVVLR